MPTKPLSQYHEDAPCYSSLEATQKSPSNYVHVERMSCVSILVDIRRRVSPSTQPSHAVPGTEGGGGILNPAGNCLYCHPVRRNCSVHGSRGNIVVARLLAFPIDADFGLVAEEGSNQLVVAEILLLPLEIHAVMELGINPFHSQAYIYINWT